MLIELGACLSLAAAPQLPPRFIASHSFTLAWTHSIEKIRWEEDYTISLDTQGQPVIIPGKARIKGSGAGMDPPADATHLGNGWYQYQPHTAPLKVLRLTRSPYTADYDWCMNGKCQELKALMPTDGDVTLLEPCQMPAGTN